MKKKVFFERLNFSKAELRNSVELNGVGIRLPNQYKDDFKVKDNWLQLGSIWGSLNDPKYYKDLKVADVIPKPEDFIDVPYRLISATTVGAGSWKAADFSNAEILKTSMYKLEGKPVYKDHETDTDNWVGIVKSVKWTPETTQNGVRIPAGIDGLLAIDAKTNPKVARGALIGAIQSNSVTVDFKWVMSHAFEDVYEFYDKVGTIAEDGKMIRRIVVEVIDFYETSLLWLGADPFAKKIGDTGLQNIDTGSIYEYMKSSFGKDVCKFGEECDLTKKQLENEKKYKISFALDKSLLSLAQRQESKLDDMDEILQIFVATFGKQLGLDTDKKLTKEQFESELKKLSFLSDDDKKKMSAYDKFIKDKFEQFTKDNPDKDFDWFAENHEIVATEELSGLREKSNQVEQLTKDKKDLEETIAGNKEFVELGKTFIEDKRNEAIRLYKLAAGDNNVDDAVIELFKKADNKQIDGLLKQYTNSATSKFTAVCKSCGSKEFSFQSSFVAGNDNEDVDAGLPVITVDDMREALRKENQVNIDG